MLLTSSTWNCETNCENPSILITCVDREQQIMVNYKCYQ
jgi:hypothetical protein